MQVAHGYNVPLNSHYEFRYKLHHMDKQMKPLFKLMDWIMQKPEKKKQFAAVNSEEIFTSWRANVKLTLHMFKNLIKWLWARENLFENAGKSYFYLSASAASLETLFCSDYCFY